METKHEIRFNEIQKIAKGILTKPITKLSQRELSLLPLALTFGDCFYKDVHGVEMQTRDLRCTHSATSFNHLCDMICLVDEYNGFNHTAICTVLEKHKDFINFDETSFGRDYSPVLHLSLKQYYGKDTPLFMKKALALAEDLKEVALCDELQWCLMSTISGNFEVDKPTSMWCPIYDSDNKITGYEEKTFNHFRKFRVWWD